MPSANNSLLQTSILGAADLERALTELASDKDIRLSLKRALANKATFAMRDYARSLAPKYSGRMAKKIEVSTTLSRRQRADRGWGGGKDPLNREAVLYIGAGARGPAVLDEFGTGPRKQKNGKSTGATPPQPFMRPAWETFKDAILAEFTIELWAQIEKSAKRIARRQAKLLRESQ